MRAGEQAGSERGGCHENCPNQGRMVKPTKTRADSDGFSILCIVAILFGGECLFAGIEAEGEGVVSGLTYLWYNILSRSTPIRSDWA